MHTSVILSILALISIFLVFSFCKKNTTTGVPLSEDDFCSSIHRDNTQSLSAEFEDFAELAATKSGAYVLEDGASALVSRAWLSEYAEKTIDIQYFIFSTDNVGLIACDYLVRAADRGVKVRILVDDILVDAQVVDILSMDAHPNIDIKIYNPGVNIGKSIFEKIKNVVTDFRGINQRMHNKTFIVDGKVLITGGRNIADEYFDFDHEYNFRDRDVLLLGKVIQKVENSFELFWQSDLSEPIKNLVDEEDWIPYDKSNFENLHRYACNPQNFWPQIREKITGLPAVFDRIKASDELIWMDDIEFVSDLPGKNEDTKGLGGGGLSTDALIELVKNARQTIDIQTPYLITTDLSRNLFKAATDRGVKIRIVTNSLAATDNLEAFSGYQRDREETLATGAEIYEFRPDAQERFEVMGIELQEKLDFAPIFGLHSKSMIIDGKITVIGTFNLDPRSANLNTECIVIMHSEAISKKVMQGFELTFQPENSWRTTDEWNPDGEVERGKRVKSWLRKVVPKGVL